MALFRQLRPTMIHGRAILRSVIIACACFTTSCSSPDTTVFVQSRATQLKHVHVERWWQFASRDGGPADELDANGLKLFFHVWNLRYVSDKCRETVLLVPAGSYSKPGVDLNAQQPTDLTISIGVQASKPTTIDLHAIDLAYIGRVYHPTVIKGPHFDAQGQPAVVPIMPIDGPVTVRPSATPNWYDVTFDLTDFDAGNSFSLSMTRVSVDGALQTIWPVKFAPEQQRYTADHGEAGCMGYARSSQ